MIALERGRVRSRQRETTKIERGGDRNIQREKKRVCGTQSFRFITY